MRLKRISGFLHWPYALFFESLTRRIALAILDLFPLLCLMIFRYNVFLEDFFEDLIFLNHSGKRLSPLLELHAAQAITRFDFLFEPPLAIGFLWSTW
jgi:hypothetical protein